MPTEDASRAMNAKMDGSMPRIMRSSHSKLHGRGVCWPKRRVDGRSDEARDTLGGKGNEIFQNRTHVENFGYNTFFQRLSCNSSCNHEIRLLEREKRNNNNNANHTRSSRKVPSPPPRQLYLRQLRHILQIRLFHSLHKIPNLRMQRLQNLSSGHIPPMQESNHVKLGSWRGAAAEDTWE